MSRTWSEENVKPFPTVFYLQVMTFSIYWTFMLMLSLQWLSVHFKLVFNLMSDSGVPAWRPWCHRFCSSGIDFMLASEIYRSCTRSAFNLVNGSQISFSVFVCFVGCTFWIYAKYSFLQDVSVSSCGSSGLLKCDLLYMSIYGHLFVWPIGHNGFSKVFKVLR